MGLMEQYKDLQGMPVQPNEGTPFLGRLVDLERSDDGVVLKIPFDMLDNAGISKGSNKVEVWGKCLMEQFVSGLQQGAKSVNVVHVYMN